MEKFEQDAADFKADLMQLGISVKMPAVGIGALIGYSQSHVANVLNGAKAYTPGMRMKIGELIAAKGNGQVAEAEPENDLSCEPRFHIAGSSQGDWNVVEKVWVLQHKVIAYTKSEKDAHTIVDALNGETG